MRHEQCSNLFHPFSTTSLPGTVCDPKKSLNDTKVPSQKHTSDGLGLAQKALKPQISRENTVTHPTCRQLVIEQRSKDAKVDLLALMLTDPKEAPAWVIVPQVAAQARFQGFEASS